VPFTVVHFFAQPHARVHTHMKATLDGSGGGADFQAGASFPASAEAELQKALKVAEKSLSASRASETTWRQTAADAEKKAADAERKAADAETKLQQVIAP
jgi:hypothetical protein